MGCVIVEKLSLSEYELCAQCVHYREILEEDYSVVLPRLNRILLRCDEEKESMIEEIFSKYIIYKNATEVYHQYFSKVFSANEITNVLIFKQSQDPEINILAKVKCYKYGRINDNRKKFLKWQIDKLLLGSCFEMMEEYKIYQMENGIKDYLIPDMIIREL